MLADARKFMQLDNLLLVDIALNEHFRARRTPNERNLMADFPASSLGKRLSSGVARVDSLARVSTTKPMSKGKLRKMRRRK